MRTKDKRIFRITFKPGFRTQFWPKSPCKCPNFSKLASKHKAPKSDSSQDKYTTTTDNIHVTVGKCKHKNNPENSKHKKKINMRSDLSDSDDDKDSQVRGKPIIHDISSDQETDTDQQTTVAAPLRRPNTWPKVLTCGRGRGKFP